MASAVDLYLDEVAEAAIRAVWTLIETAGVPSPGSEQARPYVRLARFDSSVNGELRDRVKGWAQSIPTFDLLLSGCGTFPGTVFLAPRPSADLLEAHARLEPVLAGTPGLDPAFRSGHWIPALLLASPDGDEGVAIATGIARTVSLPIPARVIQAALVETSPLRVIETLPLRSRERS